MKELNVLGKYYKSLCNINILHMEDITQIGQKCLKPCVTRFEAEGIEKLLQFYSHTFPGLSIFLGSKANLIFLMSVRYSDSYCSNI